MSTLERYISIFISAVIMFAGQPALADRIYTTDEDFDVGTLVDVNHDDPDNNQLQLDSTKTSFAFVNVAAAGRGTIVQIDAETGEIMGEYRTAPEGAAGGFTPYPSRTSIDSRGNVWSTNRDEAGELDGGPHGSVVKIGLIVGGTRVTVDESGNITADPAGQYLQPPFDYNTCNDRDGDNLIKTSGGLGDVLSWPDVTDGVGGVDGIVEDAEDECILLYQRLADAEEAHHISVDAEDNVWVGGYPNAPAMFYKLNGDDGAVIDSFDAATIGCGGFGGLVDGNGILWSAGPAEGQLMHYDPATTTGGCIPVTEAFGVGIDNEGFIWTTLYSPNQIAKVDPADFSVLPDFPKSGDPAFRAPEGVAVTMADNDIWVANGSGSDVSRLDDNGDFLSLIDVGETPTGVAVDANGKVWVTNLSDNSVMRIDPTSGDDGLGAVDLTVDLGAQAEPDNYAGMTGSVPIAGESSPQGTWTVIEDSGIPANIWETIIWNTEPEGSQPEDTGIMVEARAADSQDGLETENYLEIENGVPFSLTGQFIEIRVTLQPDDEGNSPILSDLETVSAPPEGSEEEMVCDVDGNGVVDFHDIFGIYFSIGDSADGSDDPRDWDTDGIITVADARGCVQECTNLRCDFPAWDRRHYKEKRHWRTRRHWKPAKTWKRAGHWGRH
jgi:DNA-binding beta-propeller fold protein YncE